MAICTRIAPGISAAAVALGLALTPAAFAQDAMQQDIDFKNALSQGHVVQAPADQQRHRAQGPRDNASRHLQVRQEARR
jgi:pentapeptide MXKDX repeat protein